MGKRFSALIVAIIFGFAGLSAQAATSVYTTSEAGGGNPVFDELNSLGLPDGASATITPFAWISYQTDALFNAFDITVELDNVTGSTTLAVFAGQSDGAGGFTNLAFVFFEAVQGVNNIVSDALSAHCSTIGGCDNFIVFNFETGRNLLVDSADLTANLVAATPEPGTWMLMLLGFAMVAGQLKRHKRQGGKEMPKPGWQPALA